MGFSFVHRIIIVAYFEKHEQMSFFQLWLNLNNCSLPKSLTNHNIHTILYYVILKLKRSQLYRIMELFEVIAPFDPKKKKKSHRSIFLNYLINHSHIT